MYSWGRRLHGFKHGKPVRSWKFRLSGICSPIQLLIIHSKIKTWGTSKCCACVFICRLLIKIIDLKPATVRTTKSRVLFNAWWSCWPRKPDTGSLFQLHVPGWIWWAFQKMSMTRPQKNYASNYDIDEERNIIDNDDNDHERNWMSPETSSMLLIFFI